MTIEGGTAIVLAYVLDSQKECDPENAKLNKCVLRWVRLSFFNL